MNKSQLITAVIVLGISSASARAAVPLSFTHQGLLKEDGGLVNGEREMTATITDGNYREIASTSQKIQVDYGHYMITIPDIPADKVQLADKLLLSLQVGGQALNPALVINSVPYSLAANRAENVNTSGETAAAIYDYIKEDGQLTADSLSDVAVERCLCDHDNNAFDCPDQFSDREYDVAECYDQNGAAYFRYLRNDVLRPLAVVAVEGNTIGIGTAQADAPLHILSDVGESDNGYAVHIADPNPKILLADLDGDDVELRGDNGTLKIRGGMDISGELNAAAVGPDLLNRIYPIGSIYISATLTTTEAVHNALGGNWEKLESNRTLWSSDDRGGELIEAGLPNITGSFTVDDWAGITASGAFSFAYADVASYFGNGGSRGTVSFAASKANSLYGNSDTVQPPAYTVYMFRRVE